MKNEMKGISRTHWRT